MSVRTGHDWFRIICDLNRHNLSLQKIANIILVPKPTICSWKQGAEPSHCDGEQLIKLWVKTTGESREALPKISKDSYWSYHFNEKAIK